MLGVAAVGAVILIFLLLLLMFDSILLSVARDPRGALRSRRVHCPASP